MLKKTLIIFLSFIVVSFIVLFFAGDAIFDAIFNVRLNMQISNLLKRAEARTDQEINKEILPLIELLEWGDIEKNVSEFTKILNSQDSSQVIRVSLDMLSLEKFSNYAHPSEQLVEFIDEYSKKHPDYEKIVYEDPLQKNRYILDWLIKERSKGEDQK